MLAQRGKAAEERSWKERERQVVPGRLKTAEAYLAVYERLPRGINKGRAGTRIMWGQSEGEAGDWIFFNAG